MNKTLLLFICILTACGTPQPDNIKAVELLPIDSIAKLADQVLNQMQSNKAHKMAQMDSVISQSKLTAGQMEAIKRRIRQSEVFIKDTVIYNKIYRDTVIKRIAFKNIIRIDTIRDTVRITDTIKTTVTDKKKRKRWTK